MQKIKSALIKEKFSQLRKLDIKNFNTNYFLNPLDDDIYYLENEKAVLCLQPDKEIYRAYFAYISIEDFEQLLQQLPKDKAISLEVLSKQELPEKLYNIFTKYLEYDTTYERMKCAISKIKKTKSYSEDEIEYANIDDIDTIYNGLYNTFDYHASHLPDKANLHNLITNKQIIVVRNTNKELASFAIYKPEGRQTAIFDQFLSFDRISANTIKLWDCFFSELMRLNYVYCYLWVDIIYNQHASNFYKYFGFNSDSLKNYIFINYQLKNNIKSKNYNIN